MTATITVQEILATRVGSTIQTPDGPLTVTTGGWSKETEDRADLTNADSVADYRAALGAYDHVLLTEDGRGAGTHEWCTSSDFATQRWIRYERWTAAGRVAHGYVCQHCRLLTQTG